MGPEPPLGAPYRTNARGDVHARVAGRHVRADTSVVRRLGLPRFVGLAAAGILGGVFADTNRIVASVGGVPTPEVVRVGNLAALVLLVSIPVVALAVWAAWRRLPAPRALKRRSIGAVQRYRPSPCSSACRW